MASRRRAKPHPMAWVAEPLGEEPSYVERAMFGARGIYLHGRLVLVLAARGREPWQGVLLPTEREHQPSLCREHPSLAPHPVLPKWLYLPEAADDFEEVATALAEAARRADPRVGVEPSAKPRRTRTRRSARASRSRAGPDGPERGGTQ